MKTKTCWRKMESWRPLKWLIDEGGYKVFRRPLGRFNCLLRESEQGGRTRHFKSRAAALKAANKQNDLEGLPRVA